MTSAAYAYVVNYSVMLELSNGYVVERDFSLVRGGVLDRIHRKDGLGLAANVRIRNGALAWPGGIDFGLDTVLWGYPRGKRRRPLKRAQIGSGGSLIPSPIVRELR